MANGLPFETRVDATRCLVEGASIRATGRLTDTHRDTVMRLGLAIGIGCLALHDRLHFFHYNFVRPHETIGTTPAVAAGFESRPWTLEELVQAALDEAGL